MSSELDETDRKLLMLLQDDGLQSMAELSKAIGVAPSTLNDRVKRLGRLGAITGTYAHIDPHALGLNLMAFVFVGWSEGTVEADFLKRIAAAEQVLECHHVTGAWNYLLKVRVEDTRALESFLGNVLKQVKGLQRTETMIVLSSPKETVRLPAKA
ncbi:MAG: Lrp/AsnC family transcriptional regulator [Devosia nanyangense]|uniref:Lrp/AsnC family transcriptional regulator n=1 Tax=Devosia nanyangense TaxID=1228055 RepID=A0A933L2F5_9HYPH|nr:Lrp/AsnC family transcriptional regulator [Devosia nanyangense]